MRRDQIALLVPLTPKASARRSIVRQPKRCALDTLRYFLTRENDNYLIRLLALLHFDKPVVGSLI